MTMTELDGALAEMQAPRSCYTFTPAGSFILDSANAPAAWWGDGDRILGARGESLIIAGQQGTGKSTLAQQIALRRAGVETGDFLGLPITPGEGNTLYLAMDRPRQVARSLRRMVGEAWREDLDEKMRIWQGPPPYDLAKHPSTLARLAHEAGADTVVLDSLKDAAIGLNDDEVGAGYNRARQQALTEGIELIELHHNRKAVNGQARTTPTIDDIYGSTWITSGAGSVLLLAGSPGDALIKAHHVKQPMADVGPLSILHDHVAGQSTLHDQVDLVAVARSDGSITALDAARALYDTESPNPNEKERARRTLDRLTRDGRLKVLEEGDRALNRPKKWGAAK